MKTTSVFKRNILAFNAGSRYIVNQGGTSSSKTWSILQLLLLIAAKRDKLLISIVSESLPHLRRGAMRDFLNILSAQGYNLDMVHNRSRNTIMIGTSIIEFFGADTATKLRGARRDILYINECNNVTNSSFQELSVRTKLCTFLDYNPTSEFWVNDFMRERTDGDVAFIKSTYRDNEQLDPLIVKEIESRRHDEAWWRVYGLGEVGVHDGVIFPSFNIVDELPETPKRLLGLDFGFSNDPTSIVDVRYSDGAIWLDEIVYQTQMTNSDIARLIKSDSSINLLNVVADSAEPKSIKELQLAGIRVTGADKSGDSVRNGIDMMKQVQINVTKRSVNIIKELRNYRWKVDKSGKSLQVPVDIWNHSIDAARYAATQLLGQRYARRVGRITVPR